MNPTKIFEYAALLEKGLISREEFEKLKKDLIDNLGTSVSGTDYRIPNVPAASAFPPSQSNRTYVVPPVQSKGNGFNWYLLTMILVFLGSIVFIFTQSSIGGVLSLFIGGTIGAGLVVSSKLFGEVGQNVKVTLFVIPMIVIGCLVLRSAVMGPEPEPEVAVEAAASSPSDNQSQVDEGRTCNICGRTFKGNGYTLDAGGSCQELSGSEISWVCSCSCMMKNKREFDNAYDNIMKQYGK